MSVSEHGHLMHFQNCVKHMHPHIAEAQQAKVALEHEQEVEDIKWN